MKEIVAVTTFSLTLILACLSVAAQTAQTQSRDDILKEIQVKRAELAALEKAFLAPADSDRETYAAFNGGADTGIIRLLPREKYDENANRDNKLSLRGGGAYYSFTRATHDYGSGSDISLESGMLSVGFAGADYGLLLNVGDVSLDEVSAHRAARALMDYVPPTKEADVRVHQRQVYTGIELGGFNFRSRSSARVSNTYLLRSISFDRSDIAIAFRVVREDIDGSFILVFKVLKKFPTPDFERAKN